MTWESSKSFSCHLPTQNPATLAHKQINKDFEYWPQGQQFYKKTVGTTDPKTWVVLTDPGEMKIQSSSLQNLNSWNGNKCQKHFTPAQPNLPA